MIQSLRSEATKFEDMFAQLQEIQESVKIAFLNCFLDFAGIIENSILFCLEDFELFPVCHNYVHVH